MPFFKKKIEFPQFIADAIFNSISLYDSNVDQYIQLADEFHVLSEKDKEKLKKSGYSLIVADIMYESMIHFGNKITNKEIGKLTASLYVKFLREVKHLSQKEIDEKTNLLMKLISGMEEEKGSPEELEFLLCQKFADLYSGNDVLAKKHQGMNFAAMKMANALVKADLVERMKKEFNIIWV